MDADLPFVTVIIPTMKSRIPFISKMEFRYITCDISNNIGKKRNFCCSKASHKIIAMMDDDDIYNREYIEHSVRTMGVMNKDIVGCRDMIITWPSKDFETRYVRGSYIHEGTMVFRKSHWIPSFATVSLYLLAMITKNI